MTLNVMVVWTRLTRGDDRMAVLYIQTLILFGPSGMKRSIRREVALHRPRFLVVPVIRIGARSEGTMETPKLRGLRSPFTMSKCRA